MKPTRSATPDGHGPLIVRVLTDSTERQRFDALLEAEHFLGHRFPAGDRLYQLAEQDGHWAGLLLWCAPALHLKDRDAWIGWDPLTRAQRLKLIVNQARFLVPAAARRPNLASPILAAAIAVLSDQWLTHHGYAPLLAETFTDPEAHAGTCYKAAGWIPVGKTVGYERHRCDFFAFHDHPKRLWLKPLAPRAQEKLCAPELSTRHAPALTVGAAARCALNAAQRYSLLEALRQVPDPRRQQGQRYPLAPCLVILARGREPLGLRRHRRSAPLPERNRPAHHPGKGRRLCAGRQRQPAHRAPECRTNTRRAHPPFAQTESSRGRIETRAVSVAAVEPDALPFPGARQVFDTRNTTIFKKDGKTTRHTRFFVTSLTGGEAGDARLAALARGQWSVENPNHWRRDALWGEDRCRLQNKNAACALALLRTALLRPVLRCGWGTTRQVFERVAARPQHGLDLLAQRAFP